MQVCWAALLSVKEEYINEHVIEFELVEGIQQNGRPPHLFMDMLTDGQRTFP